MEIVAAVMINQRKPLLLVIENLVLIKTEMLIQVFDFLFQLVSQLLELEGKHTSISGVCPQVCPFH